MWSYKGIEHNNDFLQLGSQSEIDEVEAKNTRSLNAKARAIWAKESIFRKGKRQKRNVSTKRTKTNKNEKTVAPTNARAEQHAKSSRYSRVKNHLIKNSSPQIQNGLSFVNQYVSNQKKKRK